MDAKESALLKLDALLRLGPPDPFEGVPSDNISPELMARFKARCAAIAPFRPALSQKEKQVITLAKIKGYVFVMRASVGTPSEGRLTALFEELEREGYATAMVEKASKGTLPVRRYQITDVGRRFLDEQMQDPDVAQLITSCLGE
jgi:hypothetical protein